MFGHADSARKTLVLLDLPNEVNLRKQSIALMR